MRLPMPPGTPRRPDPAPSQTDDVPVVAAGTALWAVALVVLAVARVVGAGVPGWWLQMCVAGIALGLVGVRICRRRNAARARGETLRD